MLPESFATGSQWYLDSLPDRHETVSRIVLSVSVESTELLAMLDTGATGLVLRWPIPERVLPLYLSGRPEVRGLGGNVHEGRSFVATLLLQADEGETLRVEALVWASETFNGANLVGYGGLLEKVRFAVDPDRNLFYFGGG